MLFSVPWNYKTKPPVVDPPEPPGPPEPPIVDNPIGPPVIKYITNAKIALVTTTGIVPKGNPDRIESSNATRCGVYDISGVMDLTEDTYETAHGGFDPVYANLDADRMLPVDVLRDLEAEGMIGCLCNRFWTTVGNGTSVTNAKSMGTMISGEIDAEGVDGVILTVSCGTCTRAGVSIAKEIQSRANIPVAVIAVITPIAQTLGVLRIVPGIAIPHVLGNPALTPEEEKVLRRGIVERALWALQSEVEGPTIFE